MSRAKYSPEKQRAIMATFIEATAAIIREEGIDAISIRNVASRAGYSSATLYLYFEDINQLIALASVSHLRDYIAEIASRMDSFDDPKELYLYTWDAFCRHSFSNPSVFIALFFGEYGPTIDDTVKRYYTVFPGELEQISSKALSMLMEGSMLARNMHVLKMYSAQAGFSEKRERLVNEMTVSYYRSFLESAAKEENLDQVEIERLTETFLEGARWLLEDNHKD